MAREKTLRVRISEDEAAWIESERARMEQNLKGIVVTTSDAIRHLLHSDKKHEARLSDIACHVFQGDIAASLHELSYDPDEITRVLMAFQEAHKKAREQLAERLNVRDAEDIAR